MKQHPPILVIFVPVVIACYLGWSLYTGSLRINGVEEPIKRQSNPQEYWFYMRIVLFVFGALVLVIAYMFL